jgi:hypothetical protein
VAILCPRCRYLAAEDVPRCPYCGDDLLDQVVVLVDEAPAAFGSAADLGMAAWLGPPSPGRRSPDARQRRFTGTAAPALFGPLAIGDERIAAQTLVISRIIELAPAVSEATLDSWWQAQPSGGLDAGHGRLQLGPPVHQPGDGSLCHMSGDLRRRRWSSLHLQLELTPWSSSRSELSLRPRRRLRNVARYFCAGQATLDRIATDLMKLAAA